MFGCECYQIGGRFIAEDPDCPAHGLAAQARMSDAEQLRDQAAHATSMEELRSIIDTLVDMMHQR